MPARRPTNRQREVLAAIDDFLRREGMPPTLRELGDALGIRSNNGVWDHLRLLARKGLVERVPLRSRGLRLTEAGGAAIAGRKGAGVA